MLHQLSRFEEELNRFLKEYLDGNSFVNLQEKLYPVKNEADSISEKINTFYTEQLQTDNQSSKDRWKIDRIITYAGKKFDADEKFGAFLIKLARICLNEGKTNLATEIFIKVNRLCKNNLPAAESFLGLADVFSRRARWNDSLEMNKKSLQLFNALNDNCGVAKCENFLGTIYGELGNVDKAKKHFLVSLSLIERDKDSELAANVYSNLGVVFNIQEKPNEAIEHLNKALAIYNEIGNLKSASKVNLNIGLVQIDSANYDAAVKTLDETILTAKQYGFLPVLCLAYIAKAQTLIKLDDFNNAAEFADKALELSHNLDDKIALADLYKLKGVIERHLNNFVASETFLLNSLRINTTFDNEMNTAESSVELGLLYKEMNNVESKNYYLKKSYDYYKNVGASTKAQQIECLLNFSAA